MYVFNLVQIFQDELLQGQNVTVPQSVQDDLSIKVRPASHWIFALYMVAVILLFITVLIGLTTLCTRVGSVITTIVSFLALLFVSGATLDAQIMFIIYRNAINNTITELNVSADLGTMMFAFSWTAVAAALIAFFGFTFGICCGTGEHRRGWRREKYDEGSPVRY